MFGFGKPPKINDATLDWVEEALAWSKNNHFLHDATQVVTLSGDFFKAPSGRGPDTAKALVADVLRQLPTYAHLLEFLDVLPIDRPSAEFRYDPTQGSEVAGTFSSHGERALIRYSAEDFDRPIALINTLVHEAMHLCIRSIDTPLPGGDEAEELLTDFACIASGFGVFALNAADQMGWAGYMRQQTRAYVFARVLNEIEYQGSLDAISNARLRRWVQHYRGL